MKNVSIKIMGLGAIVLFLLMAFGPCVSAGANESGGKKIHSTHIVTIERTDENGNVIIEIWLVLIYEDGSVSVEKVAQIPKNLNAWKS